MVYRGIRSEIEANNVLPGMPVSLYSGTPPGQLFWDGLAEGTGGKKIW